MIYNHLSKEDREHFVQHGWLHIDNAIAPEYLSWVDNLWVRMGIDPNDKTTWTEEYVKLPRHREVPAEKFAPMAWAKMCEIVGGEDKIDPVRERYYGDQMIINFGREDLVGKTHNPRDLDGWHTDNDWYRQFLDSSGNALTVIFCFTDIPENGGGTVLCEDGMAPLMKHFYDHPEGLDPPFQGIYDYCYTAGNKLATVVGKKGDVFVTHGMLPHSHAPNHLHYARVISNPHVNLSEPYNLNRADGDYTLCEQVVLRALNRTSIPEYKPTRERLAFYPRTAYFKRERVKAELERMVKAAAEDGKPASSVDSIYLRGEDAIREHEKRNGYDKEIGPTGVVTDVLKDTRYVPNSAVHVVV
ncbi:hypothetical protein CspHIS471_0210200 [Cutaneotrichosporon sp. HIS471]|nr:hypothetical protein CspHIS471_0210200 [Cutaneotrichosporon sp. HIS471]